MTLLIYDKPIKYVIIHVILGVIAAFYTPVVWVFLVYQFSQLIFNRRFFLFEWKIKIGNSIGHTAVKLFEFFIGFFIGYLIRSL